MSSNSNHKSNVLIVNPRIFDILHLNKSISNFFKIHTIIL